MAITTTTAPKKQGWEESVLTRCHIVFIYNIFTTVIKFSECFQYFMTIGLCLKGFLLSRNYGHTQVGCNCNKYMFIFYFKQGINKCSICVYICRLYWTVAMLLVLCLLIYYMNKLYIYGTNKSTKTKPHFIQATELPFPAVTICNMSPYKTTGDTFVRNRSEHLLHMNEWEFLYQMLFGNSSSRLNATVNGERKERITFSFSDLFKLCAKDRKVFSCSEYVVPKVTQWGFCYTFNSYEHYLSEGEMYVSSTGAQTAVSFYLWIREEIASGIKVCTDQRYIYFQ